MPEMNGLELLKEIRKINKETLFLMLTQQSDTGAIMNVQKEGVSAYIVKPFTMDQLLKKMAGLIEILLDRKKQSEDTVNTYKI
jgi:DNA-binding response OmpR family regulator